MAQRKEDRQNMSENLIGNWDSVFVACHSWSREVRRLNKSRVHLLGWLNPKKPNGKNPNVDIVSN
jgi:hypothetical protein